MLDSSPVALPPIPRPLKRSASTASLPPTPPRTHRKHARGRSRGSCDSDSDEDVMLTDGEHEEEEQGSRHKKRRVGDATESSNEDAFWLSGSAGLNTETSATKGAGAALSKSQTVPLLYRRLEAAASQAELDVAPVSPPPSNRKSIATTPKKGPVDLPSSDSPPRTPQTQKHALPLLDSPDNPFLDTPVKDVEDSATPSASESSANPSPHTPGNGERPTMTYVFRGVRRTYQNPMYNPKTKRAYSPPPESRLPMDHPDYSPDINCAPKLLFPSVRQGKKPATRSRTRRRSPSISDEGEPDSDNELAADIRPKKLDFGAPKNAVAVPEKAPPAQTKKTASTRKVRASSNPLST
ncbi:hypothetical protein D9613_008321 [Agrocybe pediades]|uniref:Uncharacterized protein n=1 Tax=Agrocybe pediades TaxID=84607 RepID=A0A8H4VNZ3_9AGAR|nr:hypothetical protein D9613_008321 [Agrocybe pediades]